MPFAVARLKRLVARALCVVLFTAAALQPTPAHAYSLLTHEELIDLTWQSTIVPLLLSRYPTLTPAQLEHARAYAMAAASSRTSATTHSATRPSQT